MTLVKRAEKGSPLTAADHDQNLDYFEARTSAFAAPDLATLLASTTPAANFSDGDTIRTDAEGYRYEVVSSGEHLTTAGGVKLIVLPEADGFYAFDAFNPAGDGATDDYAVLQTALGASGLLRFGARNYRIGQTVFLKQQVVFRGSVVALARSGSNQEQRTTFSFPADTKGFKCERADTLDGVVVASGGAADGSRFEGIGLNGSGTDATKHGLQANCRISCRDVSVSGFPGNGFHIEADSSKAVSDPAIYGNANLFQLEHCSTTGNGRHGFYINGYDANAGYCYCLNAVGNGRWGVYESSFLGNTHIGHHLAYNGASGYANNAAATEGNSFEDGEAAFVSYGGLGYTAMPTATEADYVATEPGTDATVWKMTQGGRGGHTNVPVWSAGRAEGSFFAGGGFYCDGDNARNLVLGVYNESSQGASYISGPSIVLGNFFSATTAGGYISGDNGNNLSGKFTGTNAGGIGSFAIGNSDPSLDALFSFSHGGRAWRFHSVTNDFILRGQNSASLDAFYITDQSTARDFGTGTPIEAQFGTKSIALGTGSNARRQTTGTAAPASGTWARGDIVWNVAPDAGGSAGWICVTAGTPGTWKTFGVISA